MQTINIKELKPHPRNNEFFDDMTGEKWNEFLESVRTSGIIEPIVITQDKMIVSGHQRVRACKELGINTVNCTVKIYDSDDHIIKDLLETNIRQRGDVGGSAKKVGLRIKELERLYGIQNGGDRKSERNNFVLKTQSDLAQDMGMDVRTLQNYKLLADMIPELEELLDTGIVTKTTALAIMKQLSSEEQKELFSSIDTSQKITKKEVDKYIEQIKEYREEIAKYKEVQESYRKKTSELLQKNGELESELSSIKKPDVIYQEVTKEIDKPETLQKMHELQDKLNIKTNEAQKMANMLIEQEKMINQAIGISTNYQLTSHCSEITLKMLNFVKDMSKYDYMAESFNEIPIATRIEYEKCIKAVKKWADRILDIITEEKDIVEDIEWN